MPLDAMPLKELLERFRSEDTAHTLRALGLATSGTKSQRMTHVLAATEGRTVSDILALFRTEDLHRVCVQLGVDTGPHGDMVEGLAQEAETKEEQSAPDAPEPEIGWPYRLRRLWIVAGIAVLIYRGYRAIRRSRRNT